MEGVTEGSFCAVMSRRALVRCWITPFIRLTTGVPRLVRLRSRLSVCTDSGLPVIVQVMGTDGGLLAATAARLASISGVVGIDLNCGCPSPIVLRNGSGGRMLQNPKWIRDTLLAIRDAAPTLGVSVKLRTGFEAPEEMRDILPLVAEAKPDFVILHFRTVRERYHEVPEGWRRFDTARALLPRTVLFGSGDLFDAKRCLELSDRHGLDGCAPARGLMRTPALCRDIETLCRGEACLPKVENMDFLREIAEEALLRGRTQTGFVLQLAGTMLGRESEAFHRLSHTRCLEELAAAL